MRAHGEWLSSRRLPRRHLLRQPAVLRQQLQQCLAAQRRCLHCRFSAAQPLAALVRSAAGLLRCRRLGLPAPLRRWLLCGTCSDSRLPRGGGWLHCAGACGCSWLLRGAACCGWWLLRCAACSAAAPLSGSAARLLRCLQPTVPALPLMWLLCWGLPALLPSELRLTSRIRRDLLPLTHTQAWLPSPGSAFRTSLVAKRAVLHPVKVPSCGALARLGLSYTGAKCQQQAKSWVPAQSLWYLTSPSMQ